MVELADRKSGYRPVFVQLNVTNLRAHRTGQKKPVDVVRIIIKDTIEERILALQEMKIALANSALGDEVEGRVGRLSVQELVGLFGTVTRNARGDMQVEQQNYLGMGYSSF